MANKKLTKRTIVTIEEMRMFEQRLRLNRCGYKKYFDEQKQAWVYEFDNKTLESKYLVVYRSETEYIVVGAYKSAPAAIKCYEDKLACLLKDKSDVIWNLVLYNKESVSCYHSYYNDLGKYEDEYHLKNARFGNEYE